MIKLQGKKLLLQNLDQSLYKYLLKMYMENDYVENTELQKINPNDSSRWKKKKKNNSIFVEKEVTMVLMLETNVKLKDQFVKYCRNFYIEICEQLKDRHTFKQNYTSYVECLDPVNARSKVFRN